MGGLERTTDETQLLTLFVRYNEGRRAPFRYPQFDGASRLTRCYYVSVGPSHTGPHVRNFSYYAALPIYSAAPGRDPSGPFRVHRRPIK